MVLTGIDRIAEGGLITSGKAALLTNQSGVTRKLLSSIEVLKNHGGIELNLLFSPEHGLYGESQDQVLLEENKDPLTGLPIVCLYGDLRRPEVEHFKDIDFVIVDIQDVGSRYYTFTYTMAYVMEAARDAGSGIIVLDRPNPLGGEVLEGNVVGEDYLTFVGLYPLAVRHAMTIAELAILYNGYFGIGADLSTVPMVGWERSMYWEDTGLTWIPPSPNMPIPETAVVYPGTCLLEGTNVSEGRGTTRPFEVFGAPFIDPEKLNKSLAIHTLPGVTFRPLYFKPTFGKWAGERCGGLWLHVTDRKSFKPFLTGVAIIREVFRLYPESFKWNQPPYEYEEEILPIDMLAGTDSVRRAIEEGKSLREIEESWQDELASFEDVRETCLLY
ncbi:MAG: exo-beta-N-acetylmuramidase NamZ domain-containing protein [Candidatus Glassbacteria bacterium]